MDETGVQTAVDAPNVVAPTGKTAHVITSLEHGTKSTVVYAINAVGDVVPPVIIHKGKKVGQDWMNDAPFRLSVHISKNGWVNKKLITVFGKQLMEFLERRAC